MNKIIFGLITALGFAQPALAANERKLSAHEMTLHQIATPASPGVGSNKIYTKSDGKLYILNSSGVEEEIGTGGGSPIGSTDDLPEGSTNLYFLESRVRSTPITGYSSGAGTVAGTDTVLQAVNKLNGNTAAHIALGTGAHAASAISNSPSGNLASTTVQGALNELQGDVDTNAGKITRLDPNHLVVSTSWLETSPDSQNFEASAGTWAAYADAAGTDPVDMTGGSPTVTCARTTSAGSVLNGAGSLLITKGSSNLQGNGCSATINVAPGFSGSRQVISIPYKVVSGSLVQGDVKISVYDVTNTRLVDVFNGDVVGSYGFVQAFFDVPASTSNTQLRVGFHFASSAATAVTLAVDEARVYKTNIALSSVITSPQRLPLTSSNTQGWGTPTADEVFWYMDGPELVMYGRFTTGTATGVEARVYLPPGYVSSNDFTNIRKVGDWVQNINATTTLNPAVLSEPNVGYITFGYQSGSNSPLTKQAGSSIGSTTVIPFRARIPVQSVGSSTLTQSSTFYISQYLASGTRVTASPTKLGEYRTMLRNSNAATFTDTNGAPGTSPSVANGMRIYAGNAYNAADTNNEPTYYEIFIGTNKNYVTRYYASTGRAGFVDATPYGTTSGSYGYSESYNPATGVLTLKPMYGGSGSTTHASGYDGPNSPISDVYFDVIVSESASPMGITKLSSYLYVDGGNGFGSTNTTVRRFSNIRENNSNGDWTFTQSSANGDQVDIITPGIYTADMCSEPSANTDHYFALTINSSALTTAADTITYAQGRRGVQYANVSGGTQCYSKTLFVPAGSVLRMQSSTGSPSTATRVSFSLTRVN